MKLAELFQKRLIFVSGKGGVGKTSVSVLLACLSARQKKKTLIVEMNATGRVAPYFGCDSMPQDCVALAPYISAINLHPQRCFEEYVLKQIRFKKIYDTFFNNKYVTNFVKAVPGLNEILMLGKIASLEKQFANKALDEKEYDLIIVDAPATGHGLSSLEVPGVVQSVIKIGPMHHQAQQVLDLLADEKRAAFCLVTLAEEMPVSESWEYVKKLKERTQLHFGPVFINAVMPPQNKLSFIEETKDEELKLLLCYHELAVERAKLNAYYTEVIDKLFFEFDRITIPYVFSGLTQQKDFNPLAQRLEGEFH